MLLLALTAAVVAVPLARGDLRKLASLRFDAVWLLGIALAGQLLLAFVAGPIQSWRVALHLASYVFGIAFLVMNRRIPGMWLIALGAGLNFIAISANGGVMPAAPHALAAAGLPVDTSHVFANSAALPDPSFLILGDIFAVPASWPVANVFSIGDLSIVIGAAIAIHRLSGSRLVPSGTGQFRQLARQPNFVRLFTAQAISNLGDWIYWLAVSIVLSERVEGPAFASAIAILLVAQFLPSALFGAFFAGPIVDRFSRKQLMIGADIVRAVAVASLLLSPAAPPAHFYAVAVVLGLCGALFQPSLLASIPNLVPKGQVVPAQAMVGATYNLAVMIGPAVGGLLIGALPAGVVVGINAVSFGLSAALISGVRIPRPTITRRASLRGQRDALIEGLRYIASDRLARGIIIVVGVIFLAAATKAPLEPVFVRDVLAEGGQLAQRARLFGLITAAWGLGMLLGSAAMPALARRWPRERLFPIAIALVGLSILVVSRTTDFSTVLLCWLFAGFANSVGSVSYESILQERTPDALRGRVFAATEAVTDLTFLSGALIAGGLGTWMAVSSVFGFAGFVMLLGAALAWILIPVGVSGAEGTRGATEGEGGGDPSPSERAAAGPPEPETAAAAETAAAGNRGRASSATRADRPIHRAR